jgi:hypothetical protein
MVPFLRIVPIGGVCLTALVLVLALEPPGTPPRVVSPDMAMARGPLIDRAAHPEWPQMLVRAAYMRAGEILKLRDLPNTPTQVAPVVLPPQRPAVPASTPAPSVAPAPQAQPEQSQAAAPAASVTRTASLPANIDTVKPASSADAAPAPAANASQPPANLAPAESEAAAAAAAPPTELPPAPEANTPIATEPVPMPERKPTKLAALPVERATSEPARDDDVTGTVADSSNATIPVDIGEASSTELPIVLPRERPVILRRPHRAEPRRHVAHPRRVKKVAPKPKLPGNEQQASQVNLFEQLFDNNNAAKGKPAAARTRGGKPTAAQSTATNNLSPAPYNQSDMR